MQELQLLLLEIMANHLQTKYEILLNRASRISGYSIEELSKSRKLPIIYYRYIIYYILKKKGYSISEISRVCNRNHATIIRDLEEIEYHLTQSNEINRIYNELNEKPTFEEEIKQWLAKPESSDPVLTAIYFYNV